MSTEFSGEKSGPNKMQTFTPDKGTISGKLLLDLLPEILGLIASKDKALFNDPEISKSLGSMVFALQYWISTHYKDNSALIDTVKEMFAKFTGNNDYVSSLAKANPKMIEIGQGTYVLNRVVYHVNDEAKQTKILFGSIHTSKDEDDPDEEWAVENYKKIP